MTNREEFMNVKKVATLSLLVGLFATSAQALSFRGCNSPQQARISKLHQTLRLNVAKAAHPTTGISKYSYSRVKRDYLDPQGLVPSPRFKTHARTYTRFHARASEVIRGMKNKVNQGYAYHCVSASNRYCSGGGGTLAYVLDILGRTLNRIHFCPLFFTSPEYDQNETMLHELSHLGGDTLHYFGTSFTDAGMVKSANDAFFYGRMAHRDMENGIRFNSWGLMWRKAPAPIED